MRKNTRKRKAVKRNLGVIALYSRECNYRPKVVKDKKKIYSRKIKHKNKSYAF